MCCIPVDSTSTRSLPVNVFTDSVPFRSPCVAYLGQWNEAYKWMYLNILCRSQSLCCIPRTTTRSLQVNVSAHSLSFTIPVCLLEVSVKTLVWAQPWHPDRKQSRLVTWHVQTKQINRANKGTNQAGHDAAVSRATSSYLNINDVIKVHCVRLCNWSLRWLCRWQISLIPWPVISTPLESTCECNAL